VIEKGTGQKFLQNSRSIQPTGKLKLVDHLLEHSPVRPKKTDAVPRGKTPPTIPAQIGRST
jgi:hypothetical protein